MPQELRKKLSQKFLKSFQSTLYIEDTKSFLKDGVKFLSNSLFVGLSQCALSEEIVEDIQNL